MSAPARLPWEELELELRGEPPTRWVARLQGLSVNRLHQHQLLLNRFATPHQLRKLLKLARQRGIDPAWRRQWAEQARLYSPHFRQQGTRYRRIDHPAANHWISHYRGLDPARHAAGEEQRPGNQRLPRDLVIGFTGNAGLLMAPTPYILSSLGACGHDLLLVRRHGLVSYFAENGQLLQEIEQHLRRLLKHLQAGGLQRGRIRCLGTSNGGLPALVLAHNLGLPLCIAIGAGVAPPLLEPGGLLDQLQAVGQPEASTNRPIDLILAFPAENAQDSTGAALLNNYYLERKQLRSRPRLKGYGGCTSHCLFEDLVARGCTLDQVLGELLTLEGAPRDPGA
jgi:hypothetical protein